MLYISMLKCNECKKEVRASKCIIHNGAVLCIECMLYTLAIDLDKVNNTLKRIEQELDNLIKVREVIGA